MEKRVDIVGPGFELSLLTRDPKHHCCPLYGESMWMTSNGPNKAQVWLTVYPLDPRLTQPPDA